MCYVACQPCMYRPGQLCGYSTLCINWSAFSKALWWYKHHSCSFTFSLFLFHTWKGSVINLPLEGWALKIAQKMQNAPSTRSLYTIQGCSVSHTCRKDWLRLPRYCVGNTWTFLGFLWFFNKSYFLAIIRACIVLQNSPAEFVLVNISPMSTGVQPLSAGWQQVSRISLLWSSAVEHTRIWAAAGSELTFGEETAADKTDVPVRDVVTAVSTEEATSSELTVAFFGGGKNWSKL